VAGHERIDEMIRYVHFAEAHRGPLLEPIRRAQQGHDDPDQKIIAMLDARSPCWADSRDGRDKPADETDKNREVLVS
jgi:hypothetical protein